MEQENLNNEILIKLIEISKRLNKIEEVLLPHKGRKIISTGNESIDGFEKLAKEAGIEEEELKNFFHIEGEEIHVLQSLENRKESQKQYLYTIILLTLSHYFFAKDYILSNELNKKLKYLGVQSLSALSINLKQNKQFIIHEGKAGSNNYCYKITYPGLKQGIQEIRELINNSKKTGE